MLFSIYTHCIVKGTCICFPSVKVLGHAPYKASCFQSTRDLAVQIMKHMHTPDDVDEDIYIRHLALFVSVKVYFKDCNVQLPHSFNRESLQDYQILIKVHHTKFSGSG